MNEQAIENSCAEALAPVYEAPRQYNMADAGGIYTHMHYRATGVHKDPPKPEATETVLTNEQMRPLVEWDRGHRIPGRMKWALDFFGHGLFLKHLSESMQIPGRWYLHVKNEDGFFVSYTCCGTAEISIGRTPELWKPRLLSAFLLNKGIVTASINNEQAFLLPKLEEIGFKPTSEWTINPNSGNNIMMLMFKFPLGDNS